jgi:Protein of unknown function (DUF3667)
LNNPHWICPSCDQDAVGGFCCQCGERRFSGEELTWRAQFGQLLGGLFSLDGRLWRTLGSLVFAPGRLTVRYCNGERVRWMRPVQIFLRVNVLYILVQPHRCFNALPSTLELQLERQPYSGWIRPVVEARLAERGMSRTEYAALFDVAVGDLARTLLILLVPLTGLVMHLVALGRKRSLLEHGVLATHYLSAQLLAVHVVLLSAVSVALDQGWQAYTEGRSMLVHVLLLALWLTIAWRRLHQTTWWRSALAAILIALAWIPTLVGYRLTLFWLTYWTV